MSVTSADLTGSVIADRFEVVRMLGQGGHAVVCEVVDRTTGLPAALKLLVGEDADLAARLDREGKALALLAHPHVVAFVDAGRLADGTPYVVTELVHGTSLRDVLAAGPLAPRRALAITRQLLEALDHVHAAGMIHRDLKPENIMLADRTLAPPFGSAARSGEGGPSEAGSAGHDYVKLLDFGIAKVIDPNSAVLGDDKLTRAGFEVLGSPPYIAPETAVGEPTDARTDLYAVGIVLFEMLIGRVPFDHDDRTTLLRMHVTDPVPPLGLAIYDGTPPAEVELIVVRALAKVPDQRFASAMAMHDAVESVVPPGDEAAASDALSAASTRLWERVQHRARWLLAAAARHPARFAGVVTACVLLLLIITIATRHSSGGGEATPAPSTPTAAATDGAAATGRHWLGVAASENTRRRFVQTIAAYERALIADRALGHDNDVRAAVSQLAWNGDAVTAVIALDVLATRLDPPDHKTIAEVASKARSLDVRRRAFAIAERDGFADSIDRLTSWTQDLKQATTCDDRRDTIAKLRDLGDPRAVDALQHARTQYVCVADDAAAAIAQLGTAAKTH